MINHQLTTIITIINSRVLVWQLFKIVIGSICVPTLSVISSCHCRMVCCKPLLCHPQCSLISKILYIYQVVSVLLQHPSQYVHLKKTLHYHVGIGTVGNFKNQHSLNISWWWFIHGADCNKPDKVNILK